MIGFEAEPQSEKGHPNEDPETRNLDKKDLYQMVAHKHYMPPYGSRGVNREYLIKVYKGRCLRIPLLALKHFEVELTNAQTRRVGIPNNCLLVRKLNILLRSKGEPELGFDDMEPPEEVGCSDQSWLFRVARFVDQTNLLEFFETHVVEEKPVMPNSSHIIKVHWGRIKAAKYFFELEEARKDRKLWEAFKMISSNYRNYLCLNLVREKLQADLEAANRKMQEVGRYIEDQISKAACTYTCMQDHSIRPEMIIGGAETVTKEIRDKITTNCQL